MKKIVVIGKDGFIGEALFNFLSEINSYEVTGTTIDTLNITNSKEIKNFVKRKNCDGYTDNVILEWYFKVIILNIYCMAFWVNKVIGVEA